ncbi:MAG: hypothetical protein JJT76_12695 [Clostridiaceae bacterium]|nr:hypothetical protein [Clostridiaceae bacterium]
MRFIKHKKITILITVVVLISILWGTGILPSRLCIYTATRYVESRYPEKEFQYSFIEYSSAHGDYFVHFIDKGGEQVAFMVSPSGVVFDPLNLPN